MKIEVLWNQLVGSGCEHLTLNQNGNIEADSLAVGVLDGAVYRIRYHIVCDASWNVQRVSATSLLDDRNISLIRNGDAWLDGQNHAIEALRGCSDVDIMVTPFTNTLPIKRLHLSPGDAKEISVVYISAPDLVVSRFEQRYTCLSHDQKSGVYKYESLKSGFTAELKIDADGLVTDYPGIFKLMWKKADMK
jgi:hypothetical protein